MYHLDHPNLYLVQDIPFPTMYHTACILRNMHYKRYDPLNNQLPQDNVGLPLRCTIQSGIHCVLHQRPHILLHTNHIQLLPPDCGDVPLVLSPPCIILHFDMLKNYCQSLHDFSSLSLVTLPMYHCPTWCCPWTD